MNRRPVRLTRRGEHLATAALLLGFLLLLGLAGAVELAPLR